MVETQPNTLSGVAETLLVPLYIRAIESQRAARRSKAGAPGFTCSMSGASPLGPSCAWSPSAGSASQKASPDQKAFTA